MAQVLQETGNFLYTVEKFGANRWRNVLRAANPPDGWDCDVYYNAIERDRDAFDNRYNNSKVYKAKFKGRGLIHLTGCHNYLSFFYNQAALKANKKSIVRNLGGYFSYINREGDAMNLKDSKFCTDEILENIVDFEANGLTFEPQEIVKDFGDTADRLSLPCQGRGVPSMNSLEFLVDSALNYWRECQDQSPNNLTMTDDRSVARISKCIHGSSLYNRFDGSFCTRRGGPSSEGRRRIRDSKEWILESYCGRLRNFRALLGCFQ